MNKCYLIIVSRNKWVDYSLVTDFPASLGSHETGLKKRIKGFFPLDHADREIKISDKLIESNVHLQSWCGRIESFGIDGIPYVEQIGRPIKLAVGILQELSIGRVFVRYKFDDFESLLPPLLQNYQLEQGYKPKLIELQDIGIKGELVSWKDSDLSHNSLERNPSKPDDCHNEDLIAASRNPRDNRTEEGQSLPPDEVSLWNDDLVDLSRMTVKVFNLLMQQPHCHGSKTISHFLSAASRKVGSISASNAEEDWRKVFKKLVDVWKVSLNGDELLKLHLGLWQLPDPSSRNASKIVILNHQLFLLADLLNECSSLDDIEFRFSKISDEFQAALPDMLNQ